MKKAAVRVPAESRGIVTLPPLADFIETLKKTSTSASGRCAGCGESWAELRQLAASEIRDCAIRFTEGLGFGKQWTPEGPFLMTGHQPEFFHPGVWIKNYMAGALAGDLGCAPINVIVDNDAAKQTALRVPLVYDGKATVRSIKLAAAAPGLAYEEVKGDALRLGQFAGDFAEALRESPLREAVSTAKLLRDAAEASNGLADYVTRVRCRLERELGCSNLELPVSRLCSTHAFRDFASHVLSRPREFAESYNTALARYRRENRVRAENRPLPDLAIGRERVEVPFWVWRDGGPRERLHVEPKAGAFRFSKPVQGREAPSWEEGRCEMAREAVQKLEESGWKFRPRALSMTAFLRGFACEGFIHGIGGGLYDAITDEFAREFLGLELRPYWIVSATLLLPIPRNGVSRQAVTEQTRLIRDLRYNPQRHAADKASDARLQALAFEKRKSISAVPKTPEDRRTRFERIRELNGRMVEILAQRLKAEESNLESLERKFRYDAVVGNREYSFLLHPISALKDFYDKAFAKMKENRERTWQVAGEI